MTTFDGDGLRDGGRKDRESTVQKNVHFKQSDKISNERHAAAPHAVLVFLQRRRSTRREIETATKQNVGKSALD